MATRAQILGLLDVGHTYETAARALHIPPGQAFMIATGLPADGGDASSPQELIDKAALPGSSQHLVNPPALHPRRKQRVIDWVQQRAARELEQGS